MPYVKEKLHYLLFRKSLRSKDRRLDLIGKGLEAAFGQESLSATEVRNRITGVLYRTGNAPLVTFSESWWHCYISTVCATVSEYEAKERELISETKCLARKSLTADCWLELYRLCLVSGLFLVGLEVRAIAEARTLQEASDDGAGLRSVRRGLAVALEHGDAARAGGFLDKLAASGESVKNIAHGRWLTKLVCDGGLEPLVADVGVEKAMFSDIHRKRVAVVGPVPAKTSLGAEIDRFDRVAKFNYRGGDVGCDPETQGVRVDIAYYNIEQSKYISRNKSPAFLGDLLFPVFIKNKAYRVLKDANPRGRVIRNLQWLLLDSEFNAGPNAVYDILRFAPGQLKVFNSDLMLTAGRFKGYWQPGAKEVNYCYSFAKTHDPVLQFRYFQNIWKAGVIIGDEAFEDVMSMSLEEYIHRLQEAHGAIGRERICPRLGHESKNLH